MKKITTTFFLVYLFQSAFAAVFYVSPTATSTGTGTINNPFTLYDAFQTNTIQPGDTLYLRGGTYYGHFPCNLSGTIGNPITISSYPGEWAIIDGYAPTTLAQPIPAATGYTGGHVLTFASTANLHEGDLIEIGTFTSTSNPGFEIVQLQGKTAPNTFNYCIRGWSGSQPIARPIGEPVSVNSGAVIHVNGTDLIFRDFEITFSFPIRKFYYPYPHTRPEGIYLSFPRSQLINLVIHDCMEGVGFWTGAVDSEVYGCLIFNNGFVDDLRGHGHGLYIQNSDTILKKKITNVISFNNFSTGMKGFGYSGAAINLEFDKVIAFNNGSPASFANNPSLYSLNRREVNLFVGTSSIPLKNIFITNCLLYHQRYTQSNNLTIGYGVADATNINVTDNYIGGGSTAIAANGIKTLNFDNNIVFGCKSDINSTGADGHLGIVSWPSPNPVINWDNNNYYDGSAAYYSFGYTGTTNALGGGNLKYTETPTANGKGWKEWTGFDVNSTYTQTSPNNQVVIQQNKYDSARYDVVIYNWDLLPIVQLNISSLGWATGTPYKFQNVLDYFKDSITGIYTGSTIAMDMVNRTHKKPFGLTDSVAGNTFPEFGVFVLRKGNAISTGLPSIEEASMSVYPSPFVDEVTIQYSFMNNAGDKQLIIRDVLGKAVLNKELSAAENKLKIQLPAGVYLVSLLKDGIILKEQKIISMAK